MSDFWSLYYQPIYQYCKNRLSSFPDAAWEAEDAASDILAKFVEKEIHTRILPEKTLSYLRGMARNHCLDLLKQRQKRRQTEREYEQCHRLSNESSALIEEQISILDLCLNRLGLKERRMLTRKYYLDQSNAVIGACFGMTSQGAGKAIHRTEEQLRRNIEQKKASLAQLSKAFDKCVSRLTENERKALRLRYRYPQSIRAMLPLFGESPTESKRKQKVFRRSLRNCMSSRLRVLHPLREGVDIDDETLEWLFTFGKTKRRALFARSAGAKDRENAAHEAYLRPLFTFKVGQYIDQCPYANRILAVFAHHSTRPRGFDPALRHIEKCNGCRKLALELNALSPLRGAPADTSLERPSRRHTRWKALAFAASFALLVIFAYLIRSRQPSGGGSEDGHALIAKTPSDQLFVAAKRGNRELTLQHMDRLLEHDRIGFFYSAKQAGYLMVLNVDEANRTAVLYPADAEMSAPIAAGHHVALPVQGAVEAGSGCEWIIAVFSDVPLSRQDVTEALNRSSHLGVASHCTFEVTLENARSIRILAVTR